MLPASVPSASRTERSAAATSTASEPRVPDPGGAPRAATASVTRDNRSPRATAASRTTTRVDVDAVGDQPDPGPPVGQRHAGQAGLAVVQRPHGVEQVRHVGHARVERGLGLGGGGGRVAGGHPHAPVDEGAHDVEGARQLGGQGHQRHAGVGRPALAGDEVDHGGAQVGGIVGATPLGRGTGPRGAGRAAPRPPGRRRPASAAQGPGPGGRRGGDHRREPGRDAPSREGGRHLAQPFGLGRQVDADRSVALQVDEPGRDQEARGVEVRHLAAVAGARRRARHAAGRRGSCPGDRVGVVLDGRIDHRTLGPGTDRAVFDATVGPVVFLPRSANDSTDADDAAFGHEHVGPHRPARCEDRTPCDAEPAHSVSDATPPDTVCG